MLSFPAWPAIRVCLLGCLLLCPLVGSVDAGLLVNERFVDDPIAGGRATVTGSASRFTFDTDHLTAHYNSTQSTALLNWPLGQTLNQGTDFRFEADMTIRSAGFAASGGNLAQLSFGLIDSATTGTNRTGGGGGFDTYNLATIDYFPANVPAFGVPAIAPAIILQNDGSGVLGNMIRYPFGNESALTEALLAGDAEGPPPLETPLTMSFAYLAATQTATVQIRGPGGLLPINLKGLGDPLFSDDFVGGLDDDITTIQLTLGPGEQFTVDTFALTLWEAGSPATTANIDFSAIRVYDTVNTPEPSTLVLLAIGLLGIALWRRRN